MRRSRRSCATCSKSGSGREVTLYWGARTVADLYEDAWLRERLEARGIRNSVYDRRGRDGSGLSRGRAARIADLAGYDIYAAGPPAMIDAVRHDAAGQGADAERIRFDSFDCAPDR